MQSTLRKSAFELFLVGAPEDAVDALLDSWTPDLVFRLRRLSTTFYLAVEAYVGRAWAVEDVICRWFGESRSFLRALGASDGVVSGSAALLFFSRGAFAPGDLDIYIPPWGLLRIGRYLKRQGFRYQASGTKHPLFDVAAINLGSSYGKEAADDGALWAKNSPFATFNFYRPRSETAATEGRDGTHIQVMATRDDPIKFIVNSFHSTGVMNYFTSTYAISLFPRSTFVDRRMYVCQDTTRNAATHRAWKAKYEKRGYNVITAEDSVLMPPELLTWSCKVGDERTWVMPFKCSGVTNRPSIRTSNVAFEVLPSYYRVAPAGAALRIGPKFVFSSIAFIASDVDVGCYRSAETIAGFGSSDILGGTTTEEDNILGFMDEY